MYQPNTTIRLSLSKKKCKAKKKKIKKTNSISCLKKSQTDMINSKTRKDVHKICLKYLTKTN